MRDVAWILISEMVSMSLGVQHDSRQGPSGGKFSRVFGGPGMSTDSNRTTATGISDLGGALLRGAPELFNGGLPGPMGTWIRVPQPHEVGSVNAILGMAGDELAPWEADAIRSFTLTSILRGVFESRPLEEQAEELVRGGAEQMLAGFSMIFVAVNYERQVVGVIHSRPPLEMISAMPGLSRQERQRAQMVISKITGVGVLPDWRQMGIGKRLSRYLSAITWNSGCRLLYGQFAVPSGLSNFFVSSGFDVLSMDEGILLPLGDRKIVRGIKPEAGNSFFARRFEITSGE
jgi:hypothetical protein